MPPAMTGRGLTRRPKHPEESPLAPPSPIEYRRRTRAAAIRFPSACLVSRHSRWIISRLETDRLARVSWVRIMLVTLGAAAAAAPGRGAPARYPGVVDVQQYRP